MKNAIVGPLKKAVKGIIFFPRVITSRQRVLPDVLIIGAQKAGTTSLYNYLVQHPDIFPSYRKEVHFFDNNYKKGEAWYRAFFPTKREKEAQESKGKSFHTIDASPYYMFHPHVAARAKKLVPNAKIILILRDPVDRAVSHYNHELRKGTETLAMPEAFKTEEKRISAGLDKMLKDESYNSLAYNQFSYLKRGKYIEQIQAWKQHFADEQMRIVMYDDFVADTQGIMDEMFSFIGVEPMKLSGLDKRHNQHAHSTKADSELVQYLSGQFKPFNQALFELLGKTYNWK